MGIKPKETMLILFKVLLLVSIILPVSLACAEQGAVTPAAFSYDKAALPKAKPWNNENFRNNPANFQFVVIGDRTGGANVEGTFKLAVDQLDLLQPEFVINVGDIIEGYSDDKTELNGEWDEMDKLIDSLDMPFFRTPGNHDIANSPAQEVWRERYGASYYYFIYQNVLFMVLNSEDPPREAPPGIKEKLELYNKLQIEDPDKAKAMLAEFMSDDGPQIGNIALKGIFDRKGLDPSLFGAYDRKGAPAKEGEIALSLSKEQCETCGPSKLLMISSVN